MLEAASERYERDPVTEWRMQAGRREKGGGAERETDWEWVREREAVTEA
jgi:hypothetical protein